MENRIFNFEDNNDNGLQDPAGQAAHGSLPQNMASTALTQPASTAITGGSLANNNQSVVRRKPVKIIEKDDQLTVEGDKESIRQTFGTVSPDLVAQLMLQVQAGSPSSPLGVGVDRNSSLAALHDIAPRDVLEGMLSTQMVAGHNHAMDSLRKSSQQGQPASVVHAHEARAEKFMKIFCMQMEALTKHRNSCTQRMVQEVHVHHGALVGAIGMQQTGDKGEDKHDEPIASPAQKRLAKKRKPSG